MIWYISLFAFKIENELSVIQIKTGTKLNLEFLEYDQGMDSDIELTHPSNAILYIGIVITLASVLFAMAYLYFFRDYNQPCRKSENDEYKLVKSLEMSYKSKTKMTNKSTIKLTINDSPLILKLVRDTNLRHIVQNVSNKSFREGSNFQCIEKNQFVKYPRSIRTVVLKAKAFQSKKYPKEPHFLSNENSLLTKSKIIITKSLPNKLVDEL